MKKTILSLAAAAALAGMAAFSASSAHAVACGSSTGLDTTNVQLTFVNGSSVAPISATSCAGVFLGNDVGNQGTLLTNLNTNNIFTGYTDDIWDVDGVTSFAKNVPADASKGGTFTLDFTPDAFSVFALSLKASNRYAVYLFDLSPLALMTGGGTFKMNGILNNGGQIADLSHLTAAVYPTTVVPLPAALPLFLAALGGLGFLGWRRRTTAAA